MNNIISVIKSSPLNKIGRGSLNKEIVILINEKLHEDKMVKSLLMQWSL